MAIRNLFQSEAWHGASFHSERLLRGEENQLNHLYNSPDAKNKVEVHQLRFLCSLLPLRCTELKKNRSVLPGALKMLVLQDARHCLNRCGDGTGETRALMIREDRGFMRTRLKYVRGVAEEGK